MSVSPSLTYRLEGESCPAGLGRGKHALGGWLGQVWLAINALFVKG